MGFWNPSKVSSLAKKYIARLFAFAVFVILHSLELQAAPDSDLWAYWEAHHVESFLVTDHQSWSNFLNRYLVTTTLDGIYRVDYDAVTAEDHENLKQYLLSLQSILVTDLSRTQQLPYWINLYNAFTVHLIVEH